MKILSKIAFCLLTWLLTALLLGVPSSWARPTTPQQARTAVLNWLGLDARPLGAPMGRQIREVQTFNYQGSPTYYVVYLNPSGLVILPGDDLVEPIICFMPSGQYDPSSTTPLGALVSQDLPGRVLKAREIEAQAQETNAPLSAGSPWAAAQSKWHRLTNPETSPQAFESETSSISDVRVAPFVQCRWDQTTVNGNACYNYYTPPNVAGSASNYPCGCVATAMSQLMRYWQWPQQGIGVNTFTIAANGIFTSGNTRGGDGHGGAYDWSNMALVPTSGVSTIQRAAIGALTYDAGISVYMDYEANASSADTLQAADAFKKTFRYSNAKKGYDSGNNLAETERNAMVNPNLHARYPIIFGIIGSSGSHAIICDGYGYNSSTIYHHLNMGWSGSDDAWYNLPNIGTGYGFNCVYKCVYNVYPSGSGEIIAGRVTNASGSPLSGVTVTATGGYSATTDANGIYALAKVPSNTTFTVTASRKGYASFSQKVTTGASTDLTTSTGNQWPIDFKIVSTSKRNVVPAIGLLLLLSD